MKIKKKKTPQHPLCWALEQPYPSSKTLTIVWSIFTVWNVIISSFSSSFSNAKSPKQEKVPDVLFGKRASFLSCTGILKNKNKKKTPLS